MNVIPIVLLPCRYCYEPTPIEALLFDICDCKEPICRKCFDTWNAIRPNNNKFCEVCEKRWKVKRKCIDEYELLFDFLKFLLVIVIIMVMFVIYWLCSR